MKRSRSEPAAGDTAASSVPLEERFAVLPLSALVESKFNPRKVFDGERLKELAASILSKGVVEPLVVRPLNGGDRFEIVAGARRYRASSAAGLEAVPAVIRSYSDADVLELMLVENIQRDDLRPLDRARGFRALIDSNPDKHSAMSIASRLGLSVDWVWDQLKLLDLIPAAQQLLEEQRISVGHAVPIARLKPADQERVIDADADNRDRGGLWQTDAAGLPWDEDDPANKGRKVGPYDELKPVSIRELERWIAEHIRFDVRHAAAAVPLQFEAVAAKVDEALAKPGRGRKVIAITFESFTQPDARDDSERTYGPSSWKRADGSEKTTRTPWPANKLVDSPTCEYSVLGVVAVGDHRGQSFDVCIARDRCQVHWAKEIKARAAGTKTAGGGKTKAADERRQKAAAREDAKRRLGERRWTLFLPALNKAVRLALEKQPGSLPRPLYESVLKYHRLPAKTKPAQLQKALLADIVEGLFNGHAWSGREGELVKWAKALKVNVKACEPSKEAVEKGLEKPEAEA